MPVDPAIIGAASFLTVKFAGYTYAGHRLNIAYGPSYSSNAFGFGLARALLGLAAGIAFFWAFDQHFLPFPLPQGTAPRLMVFVLLNFLMRMAEWAVLIWFFYERKLGNPDRRRLLRYSALGTIWSFALDVPAWVSTIYMAPGMWVIC
jgi:hypothetical protein